MFYQNTFLNVIFIGLGFCQTSSWSGGTIESPNYPNSFGSNSLISYIIIAKPGRQIQLNFTDFSLKPLCDFISVSSILISF